MTTTPEPPDAEAVKPTKKKNRLRYVPPVKVIVIDPTSEYCKTVWCAIGIASTNIAIGAVLIVSIFYAIKKDSWHVAVGAFAFVFFMSEAIMALHYANGWSTPMRSRHRKIAHVFLHSCGLLFTLIVVVKMSLFKKISLAPHIITAVFAVLLMFLCFIAGPIAWILRRRWATALHMSLGLLAFIMASFCVVFGMAVEAYRHWAGIGLFCTLVPLVGYYTTYIVISAFIKCQSTV